MSVTSVPKRVVQELWVVAGGRCEHEGCNKPLWYDIATKKDCNASYVAHIIADAPDGPRGDPVLSPLKCKDIANLMLMCGTHHNMIDHGDLTYYTVDRLTLMKQAHEKCIEFLTGHSDVRESHVGIYTPNVGDHMPRVSIDDALKAMFPQFIPAERTPILISTTNSVIKDHDEAFWLIEREQLKQKLDVEVKRRISDGSIKHLSIFAFGAQPLLIELGHQLSDIPSAEVYQKHRDPDTWAWQEETSPNAYHVIPPQNICATVALNLSLSGTITNDRITNVVGKDASIWTMTVDRPYNDYLQCKRQLVLFRSAMRSLYDEIKRTHGQKNKIHVFPACPVAAAIEIGRTRMPKADLPLVLYDQNNKHKSFIKAFEIE